MATYTSEIVNNKNKWEDFVLGKKPSSFLQSWAWGETNKKIGSKIFRIGFKKGGKIVGACLLIKEGAKRGPHFVVPGGPVINWQNKYLVSFFISTIKDLAKKEKVWFVRIRPEVKDGQVSRKYFKNLGFVPAPMHLHAQNTWVLEIQKSDEEILAGMRKSTRYLVRRSLKSNLMLKTSEDPKEASLLYSLQKQTAKRHGFVGFSKKLFESEIESFAEDNNALVFTCYSGNKPLAAAIIIFYGDTAYYHFSGSRSDFSQTPFSYFLQWKIIQESRKRGLRYYNFWGISPNNNPKHRFFGVTLFKTGFGGRRVDWLQAQDFPVSPFYWATYLFETGRRFFRHL